MATTTKTKPATTTAEPLTPASVLSVIRGREQSAADAAAAKLNAARGEYWQLMADTVAGKAKPGADQRLADLVEVLDIGSEAVTRDLDELRQLAATTANIWGREERERQQAEANARRERARKAVEQAEVEFRRAVLNISNHSAAHRDATSEAVKQSVQLLHRKCPVTALIGAMRCDIDQATATIDQAESELQRHYDRLAAEAAAKAAEVRQ